MKKLVIINHLGEIVREVDVFLEGQDTELTWPTPTAIWLGKIIICDPAVKVEAYVAPLPFEVLVVESEPEPAKAYSDPTMPVKCRACSWVGDLRDCNFGDDDHLCPQCGNESIEEVSPNDSETISDSSAGDAGAGEAEQSPSPEESPKKNIKRVPGKGSKRVRDSKAA